MFRLFSFALTASLLLILTHTLASAHSLPSFTTLIEKASPAVVQIDTSKANIGENSSTSLGRDIPEIFGEHFKNQKEGSEVALASGTGFIISPNGYVLTNQHVIEDADSIIVRLNDRRTFKAKMIGFDKRSDLALLKIEATQLPALTFADVEQLKVGEWVVAIGSPFGLDYSASAGIVSAIGRSIPTDAGDNYVPFIQSDVALNPGNSGGPLLDLKGHVIGINSLIFSRSGGSIGLSFAVPANIAIKVIEQLKSKGYVDRGWLGVYIQDIDKYQANLHGLDKPVGALVVQVEHDSPADKAGLLPGDIVLSIDNKDIVDSNELPHIIGLMAPGEIVTADIIQKDVRKKVNIMVGALPAQAPEAQQTRQMDQLGLIISAVEDDGLGSWRTGVFVEEVKSGSVAETAGIIRGDVIMQLGFNSIDSPSQYAEAVKKIKVGEPVSVRLLRQGISIVKLLKLEP